jgi:dCMP deaminase
MSLRDELKDRVFLDIAVRLGQLGTCRRAQVGAVITKEGRCVSWGYNGAPPGLPHCVHLVDTGEDGCTTATHAEANAVAFAARQGISTEGGTLYSERSPCASCAQLIIATGIKRVVYALPYRDDTGIFTMMEAGLEVKLLGTAIPQ